jgi:alpha-D-ribose 1-methylphosphonate 5-triphosphate synthase subunit PhnG
MVDLKNLAYLKLESLRKIVQSIIDHSKIEIIQQPHTAYVLAPEQTPLPTGELVQNKVSVSQCTVSVDGIIGYAYIVGDSLERTFCLAIIAATLAGKNLLTDES